MTKSSSYKPPARILTNYARVLIEFALGNGKGIKPGDVVHLQFDADALPLALETYRVILQKGGHPIVKMNEESFTKIFMHEANDDQLTFFPRSHLKSLIETIDHRIYLMAPRDPFNLKGADPKKIMRAGSNTHILKKWLFDKEDQGKLTWTLCLYATEGLAREAGLNMQSFWKQIRQACFLDDPDPLAKWRAVSADINKVRDRLTALPIDTLHVRSKDTDLTIKLGESRQWLSGGGHNIPSFEIFTSPDWRGTEGHIYFDYPLYRYGNLIKDIRLTFKDGKIVEAKAGTNQKLLQELVGQTNADRIGEYSLTDTNHSHINKFMANTLFDENYGGKWGNTHLAVGSSYHDAYIGDKKSMKKADWARLGFNDSPEHTDIMATHDRVVEATLRNGTKRVIYAKGHFEV